MHGPCSVFFFFFFLPQKPTESYFLLYLLQKHSSSYHFFKSGLRRTRLALIFNLDFMPFHQAKLMKVSSPLASSAQALLFYLSHTFDLVRIAVIPTVSPIVYVTIPGAITNSASLPNPIADVGRNKLFTDRFIFLHCSLSKKTIHTWFQHELLSYFSRS